LFIDCYFCSETSAELFEPRHILFIDCSWLYFTILASTRFDWLLHVLKSRWIAFWVVTDTQPERVLHVLWYLCQRMKEYYCSITLHQNIEIMIVHKHVKKGSPSAWSSHLNWDMGKSISRQPYPLSYSNLGPLAAQFGRLPLHQALLSQAFWCSQLYATILIKKYVNLTLSIQEHFSLVAWQVRYSHWYVPTRPYSSAHLFSFY